MAKRITGWMRKRLLLALLGCCFCATMQAQKYFTKNGNISFFSKTNIENISADNNQVVSVLNSETGEVQFSVLIRNFHFKKSLMEEHFNENYLESDKFPKASFKGTIADIKAVNFTTDGSYNVNVSGDLTIHGVTQKITSNGTITIKSGKINGSSKFVATPGDYNISIPKIVRENISDNIEITVNCDYDQKM